MGRQILLEFFLLIRILDTRKSTLQIQVKRIRRKRKQICSRARGWVGQDRAYDRQEAGGGRKNCMEDMSDQDFKQALITVAMVNKVLLMVTG